MGYIINIIREETRDLKQKGWILLYGRRKTGKTYLLRNLYHPDVYILVKRDGSIWSEDITVDMTTISDKIRNLLDQNKIVVIDEFQRLSESILEEIVLSHPRGKLILSGSSLRVVHKIFSPSSTLLGFFSPLKLSLIPPRDIITSLSKKFNPELTIELSTFLRDPWLIPFYSNEKIERFLYRITTNLQATIISLIGEIFTEEEREITNVYEALLSLIGSGVFKNKELASILYSRNVISEPSSSHINQYIKNMEEMDLIEGCRLYGSKMRFNRLKSPIMNIYYYLDDRYNISERYAGFNEVKPTLNKLINLEIQNFCADIFAEFYNGRKEYFLSPDKEIDFIITKRNKPVCVGEVKWGEVKENDVKKFEKNVREFNCDKVLVGKNIDLEHPEITLYDPGDIIELVKKH
ncbi:MAG: ATP-binding protein [Candidatus Altiarchaeales archaeon]|nr:MAG: ATP-binding protein [Candidatus Altiarchaeales archaeon]